MRKVGAPSGTPPAPPWGGVRSEGGNGGREFAGERLIRSYALTTGATAKPPRGDPGCKRRTSRLTPDHWPTRAAWQQQSNVFDRLLLRLIAPQGDADRISSAQSWAPRLSTRLAGKKLARNNRSIAFDFYCQGRSRRR
jgi:hypothetical protein